jgi:hypothetical protein
LDAAARCWLSRTLIASPKLHGLNAEGLNADSCCAPAGIIRPAPRYNQLMPVFEDKQEELERFETMMGVPRGRLAVTLDSITDAMALVGQHGVYCQSQRWPGKPVMDIQLIMKQLADAKELIQSVMEELKRQG